MLVCANMRNTITNKYKIQIVLYIKELFKTFPHLMCVDFHIKNSISTDIITGQHTDNFFIFFNSFLDLHPYKDLIAFNTDSKILGMQDIYIGEQKKNIFNWETINTAIEVHESNTKIEIQDIHDKSYNYAVFHKKYLNFDVLKNEAFIDEIYQQHQYKNPSAINYCHRFIRDSEESYINFLGVETFALYEKKLLNDIVSESDPLSLDVFKI